MMRLLATGVFGQTLSDHVSLIGIGSTALSERRRFGQGDPRLGSRHLGRPTAVAIRVTRKRSDRSNRGNSCDTVHGMSSANAKRLPSAPIMRGGHLIQEARLRAGLSQKALAQRMGTSQSLVARWELGKVSPRYETVVRAVRACGLDISVGIYNYDSEVDVLIRDRLALSVEERARTMVDHVNRVTRLLAKDS
jgi:transcriptional regulator with XRE-family HTH domain